MLNPRPVKSSTPYSAAPRRPGTRLPSVMLVNGPERKSREGSKRKWVLFFFLILLIAGSGFGFYLYQSLSGNIFVKSASGKNGLLSYSQNPNLDWSQFQQVGDGRFNILLLGIGGVTDGGQAHDGTLLTDSIQVFSLDTVNKKTSVSSVPRDFYVNIPGHGPNKINAVYEFGEMDQAGQGGEAAKQAVGKILGVNINRFAVIDFTAAKDIINTVGGIDINVPKSLYDPAFPCDNDVDYCPFSISAGEQHMDGSTALKYMRTRHVDSDFGRSQRQQLVMEATKKKAFSVGILANPVKVTELVKILGHHIKTDLDPSELQQLIHLSKDTANSPSTGQVLDTSSSLGLLTEGISQVGYVEYPVGGYTAYGPIQQWFQKNNPDPLLAKEAAKISLANGGYGNKKFLALAQKLKDYGFLVDVQTESQTGNQGIQLFSRHPEAKPVTIHYLQNLLGVRVQRDNPLNSNNPIEVIYAP